MANVAMPCELRARVLMLIFHIALLSRGVRLHEKSLLIFAAASTGKVNELSPAVAFACPPTLPPPSIAFFQLDA